MASCRPRRRRGPMPRRPLPRSCGARAGGWRGRPTTWRPGPSCPRTACPTCTPASRAPPTAPTSTSPRVRPPHMPGPPPPLPPPRKPRGSSTSTRRCSPTPPTTRNTDTGWRFDHWEFDRWVERGEAPAIPSSLRLYREVRDLGFKTFLLTGRSEAHKGVTVDNLRKQGYHEWDKLILRPRVRPCGAAKRGHSGGLPAAAEA